MTRAAGYEYATDFLQILLSDKPHYTTAISNIQAWVPPGLGLRHEAEDGLVGTFIGGWQGTHSGLNGRVEGGVVTLSVGGWVKLVDARRTDSLARVAQRTVPGGGESSIEVGLNYLGNRTVDIDGKGNKTVDVNMLRGGNVVTIYQTAGKPWVYVFIVES